MSIIYCDKHDRQWDSDYMEECPVCENEPSAGGSGGETMVKTPSQEGPAREHCPRTAGEEQS